MYKILAIVGGWLLKNSVQMVLKGAGLGIVSYLGLLVAFRATFDYLLTNLKTMPYEALSLLGLAGVDHALGAVIGAGIFLLKIKSGSLSLRKAKG